MDRRLNIGLLVDDVDAVFTNEACKGAVLGAETIDANLYIFPGGYLDPEDISDEHYKYEYQYNTIFSFAKQGNLDILYIMMGMIGGRVQIEQRVSFMEQFLQMPVVALYTKMEGCQSVIFDNKIGFETAIRHLIADHHMERVGYVSGPKTNVDAMERLEAYKNVLREQNIPYNEDYVIYGNFEESTEPQIGELVTKHPEMEAVVFANDRMALGGYRAFAKLGITVGEDLKVVSFDNSNFASSLVPPLSTVEANAAELSYQAILHAGDFLKTGRMDNLKTDTHFVKRSSCGCQQADYIQLSKQMGFLADAPLKAFQIDKLYVYLFGNYKVSGALQKIEDDLAVFIKLMIDMVENKKVEEYQKDAGVLFEQLISQPVLKYTTVENFFNMMFCLQHILTDQLSSMEEKMCLMSMFSDMYRELAISNCQMVQGQQESLESMSHLMNNMTVGMFLMENAGDIPWDSALKNLDSIGIQSAYLYTFQDIIVHERSDAWVMPKKIMLKACYDGNKTFNVPKSRQILSTGKMLQHEYMPKNRRTTMILSPLLSGTELYGLILSEVGFENFGNVSPVAFQISSALKSLLLIERQQNVQKQLEQSIEKFKESNTMLSEISRSDELTGLYNRRGFLEHAHAAITSKRNRGKRALVVYADMDNLKMINDTYGHDEGDFALREIAAILKDTFRNTDIVARFGGDEFVAFAMMGLDNYEDIMKRRIEEITVRHNETCHKPYPIEMSTGICEFICGRDVDIDEILDIADKRLYEEKLEKKKKNGSYR